MLDKIRLVAFDLDDTLWPCMPVIRMAEDALYAYLRENYPRITDTHSPADMVELRRDFTRRDPLFSIDLTLMRKEFLRSLADRHNYHGPTVSAEAFDVFFHARQQVEFYDDVLPTLNKLANHYQLGAITNGNASVHHVGLSDWFQHSTSASDVQAAKPDLRIFHHFAEQSYIPAEQILYVGDHPLNDVVAPLQAGYQAVWVNRDNQDWPEEYESPQHEVTDLHQLVEVLVPETVIED